MNVILPLFALEASLGPSWPRPLALAQVADARLVDQLLASAMKWCGQEWQALDLVLLTHAEPGAIAAWLAERYPDREARFIRAGSDAAAALQSNRDAWQGSDVLLLPGDAVVEADMDDLADDSADVVCVVTRAQPDAAGEPPAGVDGHLAVVDGRLAVATPGGERAWRPTGVWWFRDGGLLATALAAGTDLDGLAAWLLSAGVTVSTREADLWLPLTGDEMTTAERLLAANHRLLAFGRSSQDAIERSYGEDFTAITPVFLDETSIIDSAIVGPHTSVGAGATVRHCSVRNSIIGPGATVEHIILEGAIVGEGATVRGRPASLLAADHTVFDQEA